MSALAVQFSAVLFALAGLALMVGAKRVAGRIFVVGVILVAAASFLGHEHQRAEGANVTVR